MRWERYITFQSKHVGSRLHWKFICRWECAVNIQLKRIECEDIWTVLNWLRMWACGRHIKKSNDFIFRKSELVIPLDHLIGWSVIVNLSNPLKILEEFVISHALD